MMADIERPSEPSPFSWTLDSNPGWLAWGSPEYQQWWSKYQADNYDPIMMGTRSGVLYQNADPISAWALPGSDNFRNAIGAYGGTNVAFNPEMNAIVGLNDKGELIPESMRESRTHDQAFWNAALLAAAVVGGAAGGAGSGGSAAGAEGAGAAGGGSAAGGALETVGQATVPAAYSTPIAEVGAGVGGGGLGAGEAALGTEAARRGLEGDHDVDYKYGGGDPTQTDPGPAPSPDWWETVSGLPSQFLDWAKANPQLARGMAGLFGGALASSSGGGGGGPTPYTGPMPTVSRGTWAPTAQANLAPDQPSYGLLNLPRQGNQYSGLLNYLGGK